MDAVIIVIIVRIVCATLIALVWIAARYGGKK